MTGRLSSKDALLDAASLESFQLMYRMLRDLEGVLARADPTGEIKFYRQKLADLVSRLPVPKEKEIARHGGLSAAHPACGDPAAPGGLHRPDRDE